MVDVSQSALECREGADGLLLDASAGGARSSTRLSSAVSLPSVPDQHHPFLQTCLHYGRSAFIFEQLEAFMKVSK